MHRLNPYEISQPFKLSNKEIQSLFAEPADYLPLLQRDHDVIVGPRGSGKSMILRHLSAGVQNLSRTSDSTAEFLGAYIHVDEPQAKTFRSAYQSSGSREVFDHFLVLAILESVCRTVADSFPEDVKRSVANVVIYYVPSLGSLSPSTPISGIAQRLRELCSDLQVQTNRSQSLAWTRDLKELVRATDLPLIARTIRDRTPGHQPLGVLIDGYGFLGPLAAPVNNWMRASLTEQLCIKASAIIAQDSLLAELDGIELEPNLDYRTTFLQPDATGARYEQFLRSMAANRLKAGGYNATAVEDDRAWELGEYRRAVLASSGVARDFLEILSTAWRRAFGGGKGTPPVLSSDAVNDAIEQSSNDYLSLVLGAQDLATRRGSIKELIESACSNLSTGGPMASGFILDLSAGHPQPATRSRLHRAFQLGALQCPAEDRRRVEFDENYVPMSFFVNRRAIPKFKRALDGTELISIQGPDIDRWMQSKGFAHLASPPKALPLNPPAFLSIAVVDRKRTKEQERLIKIIGKIMRDRQQATDPSRHRTEFIQDCFDLTLNAFAEDIPRAIKESSLVIHDVTAFRPGIAYEVGLSIGAQRPFVLLADSGKRPELDVNDYPELIRNALQINILRITGNSRPHPPLQQLINRHLDRNAPPIEIERSASTQYVFVYVGHANHRLRVYLAEWLKTCGYPVQINGPGGQSLALGDLINRVASAHRCIVDFDGSDLSAALILGLSKILKVPAVELYEHNRSRHLSMWPGSPVSWQSETLGTDLERLEAFLKDGE